MVELPETLKQVKIVDKNGRPTSVDDYDSFMQFLMQAAATAQLVKLRKLEESKIPRKTVPLKVTVTDTVMKLTVAPPWISYSLLNDGPGAITVWDNTTEDPLQESMIASNESHSVNMDYPVVTMLCLKAASGTTATVRIYGKEGQLL